MATTLSPLAIAADGLSPDNTAKLGALARRLGRTVPQSPAGLRPTDVVCAGTPSRERFLAIQEMVDADAVIGIHTSAAKVDLLRVAWPSGKLDEFRDVAADAHYLVDEEKGLSREPIRGR